MKSKSAKEVALENYKLVTEKFESGTTSAAEISRQTSIPPRTVSRFIELWKDRTPVDQINAKGRPPKITPAHHSYICIEIAKSPSLSSRDLQTRLSEKKGVQVVDHP